MFSIGGIILNNILFYIKMIILKFIPLIPYIIIFRLIMINVFYKKSIKTNAFHEIGILLFLFFCFSLISQTISFEFFLQRNFEIKGGQNFIPFKGISQVLNSSQISYTVINIWGNIIMFVPIGFLPPMLWKFWKKFWKSMGLGFCFSFFIEFMQLFSIRSTDVDDLILNTLGAILGYIMYFILHKICKNFIDKLTVISIEK